MKVTLSVLATRNFIWAYMYSQNPSLILNTFKQMRLKGKACKVMVF